MKKLFLSAALLLPLLVPAFITGQNALEYDRAETWRITIRGYDPRDLLQGRYITFAYDWPYMEGIDSKADFPALCLRRAADGSVAATPATAAESCSGAGAAFLRGHKWASRDFMPSLNRFYVDEADAPRLERLMQEGGHAFAVDISAMPNGDVRLHALYIDGVEYRSWLAQNPPR